MPISTEMMPGCCGLKVVRYLAAIGKTDAFSLKDAETFDALVTSGKAGKGEWASYGRAPDTVCVISESPRYTKPEEFQRQVEFLKSKGWQELASWKSAESGKLNYLWGSPGIKNI